MIVPSSARPPRRAPSACASTSSTTASGHEAREQVADVPPLGVGLLARACDRLERERDLVGERLERGAVLALDAAGRLDLERAAPLAHHDEREALAHAAGPGRRRPATTVRRVLERERRAGLGAARERDRGLDRGAVDLLVGRRGDERRGRRAQLRLAGERALVARRRSRRAARRRARSAPPCRRRRAAPAGTRARPARRAPPRRGARGAPGVSFGAVSGTGSDVRRIDGCSAAAPKRR